MSNAFWNFLNRLVPGTKAKANEVNSLLDGVEAGFASVESSVGSAASQASSAAAAAAAATTAATAASTAAAAAAVTANAALARSGGTMTGPIVLAGAASASLHPVTKQQFDAELAAKAPLASPVFTGNVTVPSPTLPSDAANKAYSDAISLSLTAYIDSQIGTRAPTVSPSFSGTPTAPTPSAGDNSTRLATTAYVVSAISASVAGVAFFNGRTGNVTLLTSDVLTALGLTPVNKAGDTITGTLDYVQNVNGGVAIYLKPPTNLSQWIGVRRRHDTGLVAGGVLTTNAGTMLRHYSSDNTVSYDLLVTETGGLTMNGAQVWTATNLTSLAQLSNSTTQFISASGAPVQSVFGRTGAVTMALSDITGTLGYTPVQQGTGVGQLTNAVKIGWSAGSKLKATVDVTDLGNIALESWVLAQGFLTGITSGQVTGALGFTPYNAANPAGYMTAAAVAAAYAALSGATFTGDIMTYRAASPSTGVIFLGNSGARYLFYNGTDFVLNGAALQVTGRVFAGGGGLGLGQINLQAGGSAPGSLSPGHMLGIY